MRHRILGQQALATQGVRLVSCLCRRTRWHNVAWLFVAPTWACRSAGSDASAVAQPSFARGDEVVVEARAAEFFGGRVLSVSKGQLRVERAGRTEASTVSVGDVYRVGTPMGASAKAGSVAICRTPGGWLGCKIEQVEGDALNVTLLDGAAARIGRQALLLPSPVTELNLKRAFSKASRSNEFFAAAERAGVPAVTAGYRPSGHAHVIAHRAAGWFSGVVQEARDDGSYVAFAPDNVREWVPLTELAPEPPASVVPGRGDFALIRPASPAEPWRVMRFLGPAERAFKVAGVDGEVRIVAARDLMPLVPPP